MKSKHNIHKSDKKDTKDELSRESNPIKNEILEYSEFQQRVLTALHKTLDLRLSLASGSSSCVSVANSQENLKNDLQATPGIQQDSGFLRTLGSVRCQSWVNTIPGGAAGPGPLFSNSMVAHECKSTVSLEFQVGGCKKSNVTRKVAEYAESSQNDTTMRPLVVRCCKCNDTIDPSRIRCFPCTIKQSCAIFRKASMNQPHSTVSKRHRVKGPKTKGSTLFKDTKSSKLTDGKTSPELQIEPFNKHRRDYPKPWQQGTNMQSKVQVAPEKVEDEKSIVVYNAKIEEAQPCKPIKQPRPKWNPSRVISKRNVNVNRVHMSEMIPQLAAKSNDSPSKNNNESPVLSDQMQHLCVGPGRQCTLKNVPLRKKPSAKLLKSSNPSLNTKSREAQNAGIGIPPICTLEAIKKFKFWKLPKLNEDENGNVTKGESESQEICMQTILDLTDTNQSIALANNRKFKSELESKKAELSIAHYEKTAEDDRRNRQQTHISKSSQDYEDDFLTSYDSDSESTSVSNRGNTIPDNGESSALDRFNVSNTGLHCNSDEIQESCRLISRKDDSYTVPKSFQEVSPHEEMRVLYKNLSLRYSPPEEMMLSLSEPIRKHPIVTIPPTVGKAPLERKIGKTNVIESDPSSTWSMPTNATFKLNSNDNRDFSCIWNKENSIKNQIGIVNHKKDKRTEGPEHTTLLEVMQMLRESKLTCSVDQNPPTIDKILSDSRDIPAMVDNALKKKNEVHWNLNDIKEHLPFKVSKKRRRKSKRKDKWMEMGTDDEDGNDHDIVNDEKQNHRMNAVFENRMNQILSMYDQSTEKKQQIKRKRKNERKSSKTQSKKESQVKKPDSEQKIECENQMEFPKGNLGFKFSVQRTFKIDVDDKDSESETEPKSVTTVCGAFRKCQGTSSSSKANMK